MRKDMKRPFPERKCKLASCGEMFKPYRGTSKFCSEEHRMEYHAERYKRFKEFEKEEATQSK